MILRARALTMVVARVALTAAVSACAVQGRPAATPAATEGSREDWRRAEGRPPVVVIAREGDPEGAVAMAVMTEGIGGAQSAEVAVAIAALLEARLDRGVSVVPSGEGVRARGLATSPAEAVALASTLRSALLAPATGAELVVVRRKIVALEHRPLADPSLAAFAKCAGDTVSARAGAGGASGDTDGPSLDTVEGWRRSAAGLGRVALATAGSRAIGDAVAEAIARGAAWPVAAPAPSDAAPAAETRVYDATGDVAAGGARVSLAVTTARAEDGVRAASALGDPNGALAARLGGLDAPAQLHDVTATAHARGGCLAVSFEIAPRDLTADAPTRIATAVALARQEIASELQGASGDESMAWRLAHRSGDPRDAADVAAWWALSSPDASARADAEPPITVAIGLATGREVGPNDAGAASRAGSIRTEVDRAVLAWHEPVIEARTRVEKGQGETWIALGSPCGTLAEMENDAGLGSAFVMAAADRATVALRGTGARAEAWASAEGIGVVVHGPALPNESPEAQVRRLGDAVGRSFAAEPVDRAAIARARARLLGDGERDDARALVKLAEAIAPGHPSWLAPMGPLESLGRSSDAAVTARASALRAGPLRVAVLADASAAQADAAVHAVDRWVARRPFESRACPVSSTPSAARPATYAVDARGGGGSEAWLAFALPAGDAAARTSAEWVAAALDGADGLLAHALGGGLARGWSARVIGGPRASALVVRVDAPPAALDAAVAQVRGLLDRVRQGSLADADRARAATHITDQGLSASLDPAHRLASLWQGTTPEPAQPTLEALRAFASTWLHDDALVIVAVRSPRPPKPPS